ncbi:MAG: hypothetical protein WBE86_06160 [Candidatus Acidiferrales bacterium]
MSFTIWLGMHPTEPRSVSLLLYIYFLSLMFGAVMSLLFGFSLRRAANGMHWKRTWHWLAGGAILAPALTALLGAIASSNALQGSGWRVWIFLPLMGPYAINGSHGWMPLLAAPAGAATAWVLFRIDRAFAAPSNDTNI